MNKQTHTTFSFMNIHNFPKHHKNNYRYPNTFRSRHKINANSVNWQCFPETRVQLGRRYDDDSHVGDILGEVREWGGDGERVVERDGDVEAGPVGPGGEAAPGEQRAVVVHVERRVVVGRAARQHVEQQVVDALIPPYKQEKHG